MSQDHYTIGSAGTVGPNATTNAGTVNVNNNSGSGFQADLSALAEQLGELLKELRRLASTAEHDAAVGAVAAAESAARRGDQPGVKSWLAEAGKWVLEVAAKIGTELAVEAIKRASGPG